ncbi:MAG: hypothetical protein QOD63_2705 [Actinomycetota bacterium]|nr:hypothetical protein [Actinomycetota bacterium]
MNTLDTGRTPTSQSPPPFVPTARPVRRFVVALAVVAGALVALWWSALLAPRLSVHTLPPDEAGSTMRFELHNDGPSPLDVRGVTFGQPIGYDGVEVESVLVDGHDVATGPATVAAGQTVGVEVRIAVDCARLAGPFPPPDASWYLTDELVGVRVEAPAGTERTDVAHLRGALNPVLARACGPRSG